MTREELPIKNGFEYDVYFPKAMGGNITKKKGATVADTIRFIPTVVQDTQWQTKRFSHEVVKANTLYETCRNIWEFVFNHIKYQKDEDGKEQVRSPARAWSDRQKGVDCDCYTVFISSILSNLKIKHVLRITKYGEDHFQHIYPIVPIGNGKYITIDCVVKSFDYEEPYTEKKDTTMDLEYLNGTVSDRDNYKSKDAEDLMGMMSEREAMAELGKIFKRKSSGGSSEGGDKKKGKLKQFLNKGLHVTNRLNPATAAIRAGILAAMKLNFMKIGSQLKYTYLSEEEAKKQGVDMAKFPKMKNIREKLEKIFYGAGGKPENLKKAILTGKGNKHKEVPVNGLGYIPYENVDGLNEDLPLSQLLGSDMMDSESMHEVSGLGELGEPVTTATIAAASTVLTTIVALIKKVGNIIPKKKADGSEGGDSGSNEGGGTESNGGESNGASTDTENSADSNASNNYTTKKSEAKTSSTTSENKTEEGANNEEAGNNENLPAQRKANSNAKETASEKTDTPTFWEKNKKWMKPTGIAVGSLGLIALAYQIFKPKKEDKKTTSVNGVNKKNRANSQRQGEPAGAKNKPTKKHLLNGLKSKSKKPTRAIVKPKKKSAVTLL